MGECLLGDVLQEAGHGSACGLADGMSASPRNQENETSLIAVMMLVLCKFRFTSFHGTHLHV